VGATKGQRQFIEKSFELMAEYGGTVTNVKRKSSRRWEQIQQNYENRSMCRHVVQPTNYSLMNEVYETERIVSIQSEDRQAEQ